ncbi:MAG: hypothetical protein ACE37K_18010 [Planctomycetota bacterium]
MRSVTAEGDMLPGCRLLLRATSSFRGQRAYERQLDEVADGAHATTGLPPGRYRVVSSVPNIKQAVAELVWQGTASETVTVSIAPRRNLLAGVVRTPSVAAVEKVLVLDHARTSQAYYCVTDERGRFLFCRKEACSEATAKLRLSSRHGGAVVDSAEPVELFWGSLDAVVHAHERADLTVLLSDRDGHAIDTFTVYAESTFDGVRVVRRAEAKAGVARVSAVPTGRARILAVPDRGWVPARGVVDIARDGSGRVQLATDVAALLEGRVMTGGALLSGPQVVVRVEPVRRPDPSERPTVGDLLLESASASTASEVAVQAVARDGRFAFGCDPGREYHVHVTAPGHASFRCKVAATNGSFPMVEAVLLPDLTVLASVVPPEAGDWLARYAEQQGPGALGKTCCFALTEANPAPGSKRRQIVAMPDAAGWLQFEPVFPGAWYFQFRGPLEARLVETVQIEGAAAPSLAPVDLEHLRPGSLVGAVAGGAGLGRPVQLAASRGIGQMQVPIDEDGAFRMALPGGDYLLRVRFEHDGATRDVVWPRRVQVLAGAQVDVQIPMTLQRVEVVVVADASGQPLAGARLSIDEDRAFGESRSWVADESGKVTIEPCPIGEFGLSILDTDSMKWTHLQRVAAGGGVPVEVRVGR